MVFRRIEKDCRQRLRLNVLNSSRRIPNFNSEAQNSRRRPLKSAGNRESYKH